MYQPDPYAGQYPPPPPLAGENHSQAYIQPQPQPQVQAPQPQLQPQEQNVYQYHQEYQSTPVYHTPDHQVHYEPQLSYDPGYYNNGHTHNDEETNLHGKNEYHDPASQSLQDYLRQEREEREREEAFKQANVAPNNKPLANTATTEDYPDEYDQHQASPPEKTPMVHKPFWKKDKKKKEDPNDRYNQPFYAKPTLAPANEAETYKRPLEYKERSRCNCCCYNPAMTCCSCFCMLISIAFVAAGIALIIASKVITNNCNNNCSNVPAEAQEACGTICSKVLHDGMFYGGIVVAGLAGIAVIWRAIMWTCAGYSQRR